MIYREGWYALQEQERQERECRRRRWLLATIGASIIIFALALALLWPAPAGGQARAMLIALPPCHPCVACSMHEDCGMGHCRDGRCVCGNFRWCIYLPIVMRSYPIPTVDPPPAIDPRIYGLGIQVIRGCNPVGQEYFQLARVGLQIAAEGGDRMVRFQVLGPNGQPIADKVACLSSAWNRGCVITNAETNPDRWAGIPMTIGYDPTYGPGPYAGSICGITDFLVGMGLPNGEDVSLFLVFQFEE